MKKTRPLISRPAGVTAVSEVFLDSKGTSLPPVSPTFPSICYKYRRFAPFFNSHKMSRQVFLENRGFKGRGFKIILLTSVRHSPGVVMRNPSSPYEKA